MAPKHRLIIDTDPGKLQLLPPSKQWADLTPGVDDILALLLALAANPDAIEVVMFSVTYGNVSLQRYVLVESEHCAAETARKLPSTRLWLTAASLNTAACGMWWQCFTYWRRRPRGAGRPAGPRASRPSGVSSLLWRSVPSIHYRTRHYRQTTSMALMACTVSMRL